MMMGEAIIENSVCEDYLGDGFHEKGCEESITITITKSQSQKNTKAYPKN